MRYLMSNGCPLDDSISLARRQSFQLGHNKAETQNVVID